MADGGIRQRRHLAGGAPAVRADPFDGVAQLAPEHQLGVLLPGVQALVEVELAVLARPHQLQVAQLLDEAAEQRLVEELRRRRRVQQRQALRGQVAQRFQFAGAERAAGRSSPAW